MFFNILSPRFGFHVGASALCTSCHGCCRIGFSFSNQRLLCPGNCMACCRCSSRPSYTGYLFRRWTQRGLWNGWEVWLHSLSGSSGQTPPSWSQPQGLGCVWNFTSRGERNLKNQLESRYWTDSGAPIPENAVENVQRHARNLLHNHSTPNRLAIRFM